MGLDTVELIMSVEEEFDITIEDTDAEKIGTVGLLHQYVLSRLGIGTPVCPSAAQFYRLRRALMQVRGVDRRAVRPRARMDDLLPADVRVVAWAEISRALGRVIPGLRYPSWAYWVNLGSCPAIALALVTSWGTLARFDAELVPGLFVAWLMLWLGALIVTHRAAAPFATVIPSGCETVGLVIRASLPWGDGRIDDALPEERRSREIGDRLRAIIAEQFGVRADLLTEDTHFVYDLGPTEAPTARRSAL
jgi:acyl carrier protein